MSYVEIEVISGGLVVKKDPRDEWSLAMALQPAPTKELPQNQVLSLLNKNALRGMLYYLCGYTGRVKDIGKGFSSLSSLIEEAINTVKVKTIRDPFVTTFFERRDTHAKSSDYVENPKVILANYTLEQASANILIFKELLERRFQTKSLGIIHGKFSECDEHIPIADISYIIPDIKAVPSSKMGNKIYNYLSDLKLELQGEDRTKKIYINRLLLEFIKDIDNECRNNPEFKKRLEECKESGFSVFTGLQFNKLWVAKKNYVVTRGAPNFIVLSDFKIYLPDVDDALLDYLEKGPGLATWGEGGIAELKIVGDAALPSEAYGGDWPTISLDELRRGKVKLKLQSWEKDFDKKQAKKKKAKGAL